MCKSLKFVTLMCKSLDPLICFKLNEDPLWKKVHYITESDKADSAGSVICLPPSAQLSFWVL